MSAVRTNHAIRTRYLPPEPAGDNCPGFPGMVEVWSVMWSDPRQGIVWAHHYPGASRADPEAKARALLGAA